ncbi:30S ribosomal protein S16 [Candidatus Saccharibacteria bacterium]|nr:30S ribosomal protein S16 [Candidatus Saccharibacteria bacterium]
MLAIRLQRTGRSGHTQFRVIVQDSHFSPTRGRVVAYLGNYDPHTKTANIDGEKASQYLTNGAQPSDRVARLFQKEGIKLPNWVKLEEQQTGSTRNPEKRRSTRPAEPEAQANEAPTEEAPATEETLAVEEATPETPAEETAPQETPAEETPSIEESALAEAEAAAEPEAKV